MHECLSLVHEEAVLLARTPASVGSRVLDLKEMNGIPSTTEHPAVYIWALKNHEPIRATRVCSGVSILVWASLPEGT